MGIRKLNKFLRVKCKNAIIKRYIEEIENKKLVIDISIYMYKYKAIDKLIEKMYDMCALFHKYNIDAVFIFDGKSKYMKKNELKKRKEKKIKAEEKYKKTILNLEIEEDDDKREELEQKLIVLKRQFTYISKQDKQNVKNIIEGFGFSYKNEIIERIKCFMN